MLSRRSRSQSGVALIITIIMISVITFLTIAFLALSGREKGAVKVATNQTTARLAADQAFDRAKVELLAGMLTSQNLENFDLLVSTNYINWSGFVSGVVGDQLTNVNYTYANGTPLNINDARQNLTNLFYNARPPVFITNKLVVNSVDFRYYLDLNRNGRHDRTGFWPATNANALPVVDTNGFIVTNYVVGDPEWIGGLDRADRPHGPDNKFLYRYAYVAVPTGKTLDVNYIHNQAFNPNKGALNTLGQDFYRNQGFGSWEINLAAFLYDLNTNTYAWGAPYTYDPLGIFPPTGNAFVDAGELYRYRLNGIGSVPRIAADYANNLPNANVALGTPAAFGLDLIDGYSAGPLMTGFNGLVADPDNAARMSRPWSGADNPYHFFTTQELFDSGKTSPGFLNRLSVASTNISTYDQYTYYRLLSQLGTDSAPEDPDKLNLNYVNVGGLTATNFVPWTDNVAIQANLGPGVYGSVLFFTNAVDRLLKAYTEEWLATDYAVYTNTFKTDQPFGATNIPVFVNGQMIYSPAIHRVLQMAANIWDAKTNRTDLSGPLPTVFQPLFTAVFTNVFTNVYISSFREVSTVATLQTLPRPPMDLTSSNSAPPAADELIFGVPLVIGARKGLPNFNEYAMDTVFTMTRKLELRKSGPGSQIKIVETNQFYTVNVSVACGAEFWNSYRSNYTRPVNILATNRLSISLIDSNYPNSVPLYKTTFASGVTNTTIPRPWNAWKDGTVDGSFMVPVRTNISLFIPSTVAYLPGSGAFKATVESEYEVDTRLLFPNWYLSITNRVQAMITDASSGRIIDYVLLGDMTYQTNMTQIIGQASSSVGFNGIWGVRTLPGNPVQVSGRPGVLQQMLVSMGNFSGTPPNDWVDGYGTFPGNRAHEIAKFGAFFLPLGAAASFTDPASGVTATAINNELKAYTPFNPSITYTIPMSWQANDPLVHYIGRDMLYVEKSGHPEVIKPSGSTNNLAMDNVGIKNERYQPWPTDPGVNKNLFDVSIKDPLVRSSDDWLFPTNALPTLGWLGRIHRGTSWQTVYLKSSDLGQTNQTLSLAGWLNNLNDTGPARRWSKQTGNPIFIEGFYSRPVTDRVLFDVFTTALNDNSARGRLPINVGSATNYNPNLPNVNGLAAWSALFSGMVVLTNTSSDGALLAGVAPIFNPRIIEPAGIYDATNATAWPPLVRMVQGINRIRANTNYFRNGTFDRLGDILAVPELTDASPFLNKATTLATVRGLNDAAYEWLPQQMMSLLQHGEPRFVIYAYGQALQPAPDSILAGGAFARLCTNYTITAEVATRAVVRIEGSLNPGDVNHPNPKKRYPPRIVTESFNFLPPD